MLTTRTAALRRIAFATTQARTSSLPAGTAPIRRAGFQVSRPPQPQQEYKYFKRAGGGGSHGSTQQHAQTRWLTGAGIVTVFGLYYMTHLETVPVSGRRRFNNVSVESEHRMGAQAYQEILREHRGHILPETDPRVRQIKRVGMRIAKVSGLQEDWEFTVIESKQINAFVLPGGKVFVFTGILPIMGNDDGIAAVLGHEIAHQVARHSAERMSIAQIAMLFNVLVSLVIGSDFTQLGRLVFTLGYELPYSRGSESEADYIGLLLMAQACFNPREAVQLWKRMEQTKKDGALDKFLSTHPTHKNRIESIGKWMPEAIDKRENSDCSMRTTSYLQQFMSHY